MHFASTLPLLPFLVINKQVCKARLEKRERFSRFFQANPHLLSIVMNLRSNSKTLQKKGLDCEHVKPFTGKKRKTNEAAPAVCQPKKARWDTIYTRSLIEQLTPDTFSTNISAMKTCGPFLHGQFQDSSLRVAKMEEADLVNAMANALGTTCKANELKDRECPSILNGGPPYRSEKYPDGSSSIFSA